MPGVATTTRSCQQRQNHLSKALSETDDSYYEIPFSSSEGSAILGLSLDEESSFHVSDYSRTSEEEEEERSSSSSESTASSSSTSSSRSSSSTDHSSSTSRSRSSSTSSKAMNSSSSDDGQRGYNGGSCDDDSSNNHDSEHDTSYDSSSSIDNNFNYYPTENLLTPSCYDSVTASAKTSCKVSTINNDELETVSKNNNLITSKDGKNDTSNLDCSDSVDGNSSVGSATSLCKGSFREGKFDILSNQKESKINYQKRDNSFIQISGRKDTDVDKSYPGTEQREQETNKLASKEKKEHEGNSMILVPSSSDQNTRPTTIARLKGVDYTKNALKEVVAKAPNTRLSSSSKSSSALVAVRYGCADDDLSTVKPIGRVEARSAFVHNKKQEIRQTPKTKIDPQGRLSYDDCVSSIDCFESETDINRKKEISKKRAECIEPPINNNLDEEHGITVHVEDIHHHRITQLLKVKSGRNQATVMDQQELSLSTNAGEEATTMIIRNSVRIEIFLISLIVAASVALIILLVLLFK